MSVSASHLLRAAATESEKRLAFMASATGPEPPHMLSRTARMALEAAVARADWSFVFDALAYLREQEGIQ